MALAPFVIQPQLTAIAMAYRNQKMVADLVLPRIPVDSSKFKYTQFALADGFTIPDTKVGRKSAPNQIDWSATETTVSVNAYGLEDPVPNEDIENAASAARTTGVVGVDPLARATELVTSLIELDREARVANTVFGSSTYASANKTTLSGTSQWSDFTNSNPVDAMLVAMDGLVVRPNKLVLGQATWTKLRQHPKVVNAFYGNSANAGAVSREALAALLEIDEIIVGQAFQNTAKKGQTATLGRLWGKHAALLYIDPNVKSPQGGLTFGFTGQWGTRIAGTIEDSDIGLKGGKKVRVGEEVAEVVSAADCGYLFINAVA